nr:hypothetical protein [Campylobacter lari]MCR6513021.1 hypothetical protein [Campylobacter lari]
MSKKYPYFLSNKIYFHPMILWTNIKCKNCNENKYIEYTKDEAYKKVICPKCKMMIDVQPQEQNYMQGKPNEKDK